MPGHTPRKRSITQEAVEALAQGVTPFEPPYEKIPGQDAVLQAGDPDVDPLDVEYSGEQAPGASNSSPDANDVDATGRLYGVVGTDARLSGLVLGEALVEERDRHRWENDPASKDEAARTPPRRRRKRRKARGSRA